MSLRLSGFKSFAQPSQVEFHPGVTAVVGPNGSGKSNIIDALRWCLGGGRAQAYRASDKRDLIFHGAKGQRALGYAEVEVRLEHHTRPIRVVRKMFRDGSLSLTLNGQNARLLDVDAELSGSGLGRGGLSLIGQGEISSVLMADASTLLGYLADAAGVSTLSDRREQTLSRLGETRQHLDQLAQLLDERQRQLATLQKDAAAAKQARDLARDRLQLRYTLSRRRVDDLTSDIARLRKQQAELENAIADGRAQLSEQQTLRQQTVAVLEAQRDTLQQARQQAAAQESARQLASERLERAEQQQQYLSNEQARLAAEQAELEALAKPTPPEGDVEAGEAKARALTAQREQLDDAIRQAHDRIAALERDLHTVRERLNAYEQAKTRFESQQAELQRQLSDTDKALDEQDTDTVDVGTPRDTLATAQDALAQDEQALATAQQQLEAHHAHHADAHAEAQAQRRRAQRADAALRARQGYAQGPRHALSADIDGVIGSVADLLAVPERYTTAVASALGRRAEHVVVEDADVAKRVLAWVKQRGGWVTLLPLDLLYGRRSSLARDFASETGVIGLAADLVDIDSRYSVVLDNLLGTTAIVEDNDAAVRLARNYRQRPRLVTLAGEIIESYGAISGGKREGSVGVFGLKQEAEQAEADATAAEQAAREALEALEAARAAQQQAREQYAARQKHANELQATLAAQRETRAAAQAIQQDLVTRRDQLRQRLAALTPPDPPADTDQDGLIVRLEQEREGLEHLTHQRDTVLTALRDLDQQRAVYKEQQQRYQDAKTRYDKARQRLIRNRAQQQRLTEQHHEADKALANAKQALAAANAALPNDLTALEQTVRQTQQTLREQENSLEALAQIQAERGANLEQCRVDLARRDAALEPATETLRSFPEGIEPLDGTLPALRNRLKNVDDALERLGPVNYRAATDLLREQAEVDTLAEQHADTEAAVDELAAALADIDRDVTERLEHAATRLRDDFGDYVRHLFGADAHADVALSYTEGRPSGVGLELRPPGKQTRSLGLLSVGERTMGALAFLFALTRQGDTGGLPLAVLDEVDAPLDEANIRRFCGFLQQLAERGTQFVLITHQKATMEVADVLWGVTSDAGISRLFSIRQDDVVPS